ncbi:MAG: hypothetical protein H7X89_00555 [Rhizobiales bacterium]|nr:hypothetical protein [Hyphomicrobiales bacterium]
MSRSVFCVLSAVAWLGVSAPALAADINVEPEMGPFSAEAEAWAGWQFVDSPKNNVIPGEDDSFIYGADGRVRFDLSSVLSVQGDLLWDDAATHSGSEDIYHGGWMGGGHLNWTDRQSGLLGIFGGVGTAESDQATTDFWFMGGEGQIYLDMATLYAQAGYFDAVSSGSVEKDAFNDAYFGRIVGRYFFSPDSRLQAEFSYANGNQDDDDVSMDVFSWGARYDHQIFESIGVFAAYDGGYYDNGSGVDTGSYFEHVARGGVSISFGRPDMMAADRSGPNLDMPWVTHWAASGNIVD